ncbi:hypothetical protein D3C85_1326910 [compost metagenome]
MGGDGQHRHARPVAIEQTVDQMQVAGPAAPGADGQLAGQVRFGARREGGGLLVAGVDPVDVVALAQ